MSVFTLTIDPALLHPELVAEYGMIELKQAEQYVDTFAIVASLQMPIRFENNLSIRVPLAPNTGNSFYEVKLFNRLGQVFATFFQMPEADAQLHELTIFNSSYAFKIGFNDLSDTPRDYVEGKFLKSGTGNVSWADVTKADVGLGNADNTSDANKPMSIAVQQAFDSLINETNTALNAKLDDTQAGVPSGLATLDNTGHHNESEIKETGVTAGTYPKVVVDAKGRVTEGQSLLASDVPTLNQDTTGNAATATALQTARTIGGVLFDGTANINLPGVNAEGNQNTTGNAATATKLATARNISATGDASWSASFDGSGNVTATITLSESGAIAGSYGSGLKVPIVTVNAKGLVTDVTATDIPAATTAVIGVTQLNSATDSTSEDQAATPLAVKTAYDKAAAAIPSAEKGLPNGVPNLDENGLILKSQLPINSGGQFIGQADIKAIAFNAQVINENLTIPGTVNAMSAGPISVGDGVTVTVETGATWTII